MSVFCWRTPGVCVSEEKGEKWVTEGNLTQHQKRKCLETSIATYACFSQNRNRKYEASRQKQIHISKRHNCCKRKPQGSFNWCRSVLPVSDVNDEWLSGEDDRLSPAASCRGLQSRRGEKQPDGVKWVTLGRWRSTRGAAERDGNPPSEQRTNRCSSVCSGTRLPLPSSHTRCCQSVLQVKCIPNGLTPL